MVDILRMSISASVLIVLVILLRSVAIHKLPRLLFIVLWGIVVARLLVPVSFPILPQLSLPAEIAETTNHVNARTAAVFQMSEHTALNTGLLTRDIGVPADSGGGPKPEPMLEPELLTTLWLGGAALLLMALVVIYYRSKRELRTALPLQGSHPVIEAWLTKHPLRRTLTILTYDRIDTPITFGILHPKIILPKSLDTGNESAMDYILTHEYMHIRHFDAVWKLAAAAALCLHWFNPLVWLMYLYLNRDMEMVCDARVIRKLGAEHKADYALCLLAVAEQKGRFTPLYSGFSKNATKERIVSIMKLKKLTVVTAAISLILILGAVSAFAEQTSGEENSVNTKNAAEMNAVESGGDAGGDSAAAAASSQEDGTVSDFNYDALKDYVAYGLTYDKAQDRFLYNGKHVRLFMDQDLKNEGKFNKFYYDGDGTADFKVIRDKDNKVTNITEVDEHELQALAKVYGFELGEDGLKFQNAN
ncbi:Signal transducer regulating beta-lactamase production, contains metallopeptidase domain [Paenibacillus jilunlii]|uniref:Signal transducer regulating beta-lactamase production, contains metallopeptidase domain n=2 Tax=Paenibacillus jilunlii TaxID=682956 RepID=A0A1G9NIZ1_9BACL|nr:Signal transducer regulating beta-lactamase production, contains metallopeptidase domain [Paenibacillus jilunlii]